MSRVIRTDRGGLSTPLSVSMPKLSAEPGPGANASSRRDLMFGVDLIDTVSGGPAAGQEIGNVTLDQIDVQAFALNE